ncbi:MAG: hypothetical protein ABRQ25_04275 [Clostridiaceae bacterium]
MEVTKIHKELTEIFLHNGFENGETKSKEYLNQYPNSAGLKLTVAGLINMYSMMLEDDFKELTNYFVDPMVLYASLLESEGKSKDAEDLCKKVQLSYLVKSTTIMSILSRIYKHTDKFDKSVLYLNVSGIDR